MKKIIVVAFILILSASAYAQAESPIWSDIWTNASYHSTNGESPAYFQREVLARSEGRFGIRMNGNSAVAPYIVYYGVLGQNSAYWNNNLAYGLGVRAMPYTSFETSSWALEWIRSIKLYGEILSMTFLKDGTTAKNNGVKTSDVRFGVDVWHEWNLSKPNPSVNWAQVWGNVTYRETNFYDPLNTNKFQTYVGYMQLKIGRHMGTIKPYLAGYLTSSGNPLPWLNSLYYGLGLRMEPFRGDETAPELLRTFNMYVEALNISWLADQDPTRPNTDTRFGIEFTYGR